MKCAVAIVLALIGMVVTSPVAPLGYGYGYGHGSPLLLPSAVSFSSNLVNHGYSVPNVIVTAPVIRPVITPVIAPVVKAVPIAPVTSWGGWGSLGYGWGKGWH